MIETAETVCPQCGALLTMPHQVDTFACSHCGSTLRTEDGLRMHRLSEPPSITWEAAEGLLRSWFAGAETPADLRHEVQYEVGGLRYFPFLRVRRRGNDRVVPLALLPAPEVMALAGVPSRLLKDLADGPDGPGGSDGQRQEPSIQWAPLDPHMLRDGLTGAISDADAFELLIEQRAYYPAVYSYKGERFSAAISAGAGTILAERRPARPEVSVENRVALAVLAVLFAEALLVPGPIASVIAIVVTAAGMYPLLRRYVERHG